MRKSTVQFFRPMVNFFLNHTRSIIGCLLFVVFILASPFTYKAVESFFATRSIPTTNFQEILITTFLTFLLPTLYTWLANFYKNWKCSVIKMKRALYRRLYQLSISDSTPRWIQKTILLIILVFYYQKREPLREQQIIVNKILGELNSHTASKQINRVFWIQGSPYSGKTTTVLNLFIDLISKKEYNDLFEQLDGKIIYFDLGRDDFNFEQLLTNYRLGKYENHLLVLDNLHKVSSINCFTVIYEIILNLQAFSIIVLMRKPSDFLSDTEQIVRLTKIIGDKGMSYKLPTIARQDFSSCREIAFKTFCQQFSLRTNDYGNDAVIIHLSSLYVRRKVDVYHFLVQIQTFLRGEKNLQEFDEKLVALVSASLFTGSLNMEVLNKCCANTHEWKIFLRRLLDLGFLINYPDSSKNYYYFHESLAKFYFEKSYSSPFYRNHYLNYFQRLLDYYLEIQNELLSFLYSVLITEYNRYRYLFDKVAINANFVNLYDEIDFLLRQDEGRREGYYRELGILCDRIGELQEAKLYYMKYLERTQSVDALYKLVQIDHEYIAKYPQIVKEAKKNQDIYYVLLHQYWRHHINMHDGDFDFYGFQKIVIVGKRHCEDILCQHPYDGLHLLRRIYFDLFRVYYLAGVLDPSQLRMAVQAGSILKEYLSIRLDEFEAYYIKFAVAQFLGQDVLFSLAFLSKGLSKEDYDLMLKDHSKLKYEDRFDYGKVAEETISLYETAINKMEQIGDKTAIFVRYHMYGTKLALISDGNFSECEQFYQDYMAFATRENDVEYQSYAELYKLKLLLVKMNSPAIINSSTNLTDLVDQAAKKIQLARTYQSLCNTERGNKYAKVRLDLYEAIFNYMSKKKTSQQFRSAILKIKKSAEAEKYHRELHLINYLEEHKFTLSKETIRIIVTYYPIITQ